MLLTNAAARRLWRAAAFAALVAMSGAAHAQTLTVSGSPATMTVSTATAGQAPNAVTNALTTWSVTKPSSGHFTITASINTAMPAGVTLAITLATSSGTSAGAVSLGTTAQNVVTLIAKKVTSQTITYALRATAAAGVVSSQTRKVTLTVVATA